MENKIFELTKELKNNLQLVTELFLLKNDEKIPCDSDTLDIITSAYFTQIFNILSRFKKLNKNLEKNIHEFQNKILTSLKEMSFLNYQYFKENMDDKVN